MDAVTNFNDLPSTGLVTMPVTPPTTPCADTDGTNLQILTIGRLTSTAGDRRRQRAALAYVSHHM